MQEPPFGFSRITDISIIYKNNNKISHIAGSRYIDEVPEENESYYFSIYPIVGAWATWRRAWNLFDSEFVDFSEETFKQYEEIFSTILSEY